MKLVKVGRKWTIEGGSEGWVLNRTFPTKHKAEIALEVYEKGGTYSDYWKEARAKKLPKKVPLQKLKEMSQLNEDVKLLSPTCEEIEEYGKNAGHGTVTITQDMGYYKPHVHNSWGKKLGGRVHIDIGCHGYHLMLDENHAQDFIRFIKSKRESVTNK